jgi:hypothetical protein
MRPEDVGNEATARWKKKDSKFLNLTNSLTFAFPKNLVDERIERGDPH